MGAVNHGKPDPASSQDASKLAVGEKGNVSIHLAKASDEPIRTIGSLCGYFSPRTTVPIDIPARSLLVNIRRAPTLIVTIVPLGQV